MPLMEAFEQGEKNSRYIFVPKPGRHGQVLNAVSVQNDGTARFEIKARSKTELAKKAALVEKALGGKTARSDRKQADGSLTRVFTAVTELNNLSSIIPKDDLKAAIVEGIRRGVIVPPAARAKKSAKRLGKGVVTITVESLGERASA